MALSKVVESGWGGGPWFLHKFNLKFWRIWIVHNRIGVNLNMESVIKTPLSLPVSESAIAYSRGTEVSFFKRNRSFFSHEQSLVRQHFWSVDRRKKAQELPGSTLAGRIMTLSLDYFSLHHERGLQQSLGARAQTGIYTWNFFWSVPSCSYFLWAGLSTMTTKLVCFRTPYC